MDASHASPVSNHNALLGASCGLSPQRVAAWPGAQSGEYANSCAGRTLTQAVHGLTQYLLPGLLCSLIMLKSCQIIISQYLAWQERIYHNAGAVMQGDAQHAQILPELARAVAAAVHAKQVPIQDLLGFQSFATPAENVRPNARPAIAHAFARLVLEGFVDADGKPAMQLVMQ